MGAFVFIMLLTAIVAPIKVMKIRAFFIRIKEKEQIKSFLCV